MIRYITKRALQTCLMVVLSIVNQPIFAQECFEEAGPIMLVSTPALFSGAATNLSRTGSSIQTSLVIGIPFFNDVTGDGAGMSFGPYAYHLLQPRAVNQFSVSEGDYVDQIVVSWAEEFAGAQVKQFRLLRNGSTLGTFPVTTTEYIDQNVVAGRYYEYSIIALNDVGESVARSLIGFVNPNGTVTGNIVTSSQRVVPDVEVRLTPTLGSSLEFDGVDDAVGISHSEKLVNEHFTIEAWIFPVETVSDFAPILVKEGQSSEERSYGLFFLPGSRILQGSFHNGSSLITVQSRVAVEDLKWSHIALVFDGNALHLYLNGIREASSVASGTPVSNQSLLFIGKVPGRYSGYRGLIDDIRIWKSARSAQELQFNQRRALAAADTADGLVAYLKFDENQGDKLFDLTENNHDGILCGARFRIERAPVDNAAFTDLDGNYVIDGINYGSGTTFTVRPSKITQTGRAIQLNGDGQYVSINGNLSIANSSFTVELWARRSGNNRRQVLFSQKASNSSTSVNMGYTAENQLFFQMGEQLVTSAIEVDDKWHHIATVFTQADKTVTLYVDGEVAGSGNIPETDVLTQATQSEYAFGRDSHESDYFAGLLDDARIWNTARSQSDLQNNAQKILEGNTDGLAAYWRFNEGSRTFSVDQTGRSNTATFQNMTEDNWAMELPYREEFVHTFAPETRKVTLNTSNTAVNSVNFNNTSLISVTGYVRYYNSECFADSIEIYVNDKPVLPPVYTDKSGKFTVQFEPGTSHSIKPKYKDHEFTPALFEVFNIAEPIANVVFDNMESRTISGKVGGGICLNPIGVATVTIRSTSGCFEKTILTDNAGNFSFTGVPPLVYTITASHPNPEIDSQFIGQEIDAVEGDVSNIVFRYRSEPIAAITFLGYEEKGGVRYYKQLQQASALITLQERYIAGNDTSWCAVDTGKVFLKNNLDGGREEELEIINGSLVYSFYAVSVNIFSPYSNALIVTAEDDLGRQAQAMSEIVVEGVKPRATTFTTTSPQIPFMILHDPNGDNSSALISKGQSFSTSFSMSIERESSSEISSKVSTGAEFTTLSGLGFAVQTKVEVEASVESKLALKTKNNSTSELTFEFSAEETISTSSDDTFDPETGETFIGDRGDVYIGGALNLIYGVTDIVTINDNGSITLTQNIMMSPQKFNTTFIYTEFHIVNTLIPSLLLIGDTKSAELWASFVEMNRINKTNAAFKRNISFDAGSVFSYSETTSQSQASSISFDLSIDQSVAVAAGVKVNDIGVEGTVTTSASIAIGQSESNSQTSSQTFAFNLADNDIGDFFTIDVLVDPVYGSPVFKTRSGESSCPWEPGTANRNMPDQSVIPINTINVNPSEPATFELKMLNLNMNELREYTLSVDPGTNLGGATWRLNGEDNPITIGVSPGGSADVIVEFFKGPIENTYENVALILNAACDPKGAADTVFVSFNFKETCSNIAIYEPTAGFVVKNGDSPLVPITLYNFKKDDPQIREVLVQYRRAVRGVSYKVATKENQLLANDWITIKSISGEELTEDFYTLTWDTSPLGDDTYEIRATLACTGESVLSSSQIVTGVIDRNAPRVLGLPEPGDGVLNPGDQIYVEFNEQIDANYINPLTDILVFNSETGNPIDREVSIFQNAIGIVILTEDHFLENQVVRVEINKIRDLRGNELPNPIVWEFLFDKSPVRWTNARVDIIGNLNEPLSFSRAFQNSGGSPISFDLSGLPSWLTAFPMSGSINPGTSIDVTFNVSRTLGAGIYEAQVDANTSLGTEPLAVKIRLLCDSPEWILNPADFQQSMNMVGELTINDEKSEDLFDLVGVFVGNELRGVGRVEFVAGMNTYRVFLTIYSNASSESDVSFRIWDASSCIEYGSISESYSFTANTLLGSPQNPITFTATQTIIQSMELNKGWTWTSFNSISDNNSVNSILQDIEAESGDIIRAQTGFSIFSNATGWVGTLDSIRSGRMYQIKLTKPAEIVTSGRPVDLVRDSIRLVSGWNWLGYNPTFTLSVNEALSGLVALNGDVIKSQTQFAVYVPGTGWVGNLSAMVPLKGYLLFTRNGGRFTYPLRPTQSVLLKNGSGSTISQKDDVLSELTTTQSHSWAVQASEFEYSMSMIAEIEQSETGISSDSSLVIAAFSGDDVRGVAQPLWIAALNKYLIFLTIYSNNSKGEELSFQLYDPKQQLYYGVSNRIEFEMNAIAGSIEHPISLQPLSTSLSDFRDLPIKYELNQNYPNPFNGNTQIRYALPQQSDVSIVIYNVLGQKVATLVNENQPAGKYTIPWSSSRSTSILSSGTYLLEMRAGSFRAIRKMLYIK